MDLAREMKRSMEHEGDGNINCNRFTWNNSQRILVKELEDLEIRDHIETKALLRSARILRRVLET